MVRFALLNLKPMLGFAMARRLTLSEIAKLSLRSDFMNFNRAGVA